MESDGANRERQRRDNAGSARTRRAILSRFPARARQMCCVQFFLYAPMSRAAAVRVSEKNAKSAREHGVNAVSRYRYTKPVISRSATSRERDCNYRRMLQRMRTSRVPDNLANAQISAAPSLALADKRTYERTASFRARPNGAVLCKLPASTSASLARRFINPTF